MQAGQLMRRGLRLLRHGHSTLVSDLGDSLITKAGSLFVVCGPSGDLDAQANPGHGLYFHDTRYLSHATLRLEGRPLAVLLASAHRSDRSICELTNPELELADDTVLPKGSLGIRRERLLDEEATERVLVQNFSLRRLSLNLRFDFDAGFEDMFEVRGHERLRRGRLRRPAWFGDELVFGYEGADGRRRSTRLSFEPSPTRRESGQVVYRVTLEPGGRSEIRVRVTLSDEGEGPLESVPVPVRGHGMLSSTRVETDNELFDRVMQRCFDDLRMLLTKERGEVFFAAGVPWFVALFGRDSLITALQTLCFDPAVAANTLELLAKYQGTRWDPARDEEPGKIPHELRVGELANLGEVPQTPYFGAVDTTPLFLVLLGEYVRWTGDVHLWHRLRENVERALAWVDEWGDSDGDGFVDYACRSPSGLLNQGWKDSGNAIVHRDGRLAEPPIALVEVQGFVYRAWLAAAWLFGLDGEIERAEVLRAKATSLRERFARAFWMPRRRYLALALEAGGRQVQSVTSNPGQALWAGIVEAQQATAVGRILLGPRMFNGWGIRTLAEGERAYNPIDYQVGSVWPHDNSLVVAGLKRYGQAEAAVRVFTGLFEAAALFPNFRLPELFAGFSRARYQVPVRYPVACSPQAWAAGALPYMLVSLLGLQGDALARRLWVVDPVLPSWLEEVRIPALKVGSATVDLEFRRRRGLVQVRHQLREGHLQVVVERGR